MNRNKKEKYARIEIRIKTKEKEKIKSIATKCNLSVSEYTTEDYTDLFGTAEYISGDNTDNPLTFNMCDSDECRETYTSKNNTLNHLYSIGR